MPDDFHNGRLGPAFITASSTPLQLEKHVFVPLCVCVCVCVCDGLYFFDTANCGGAAQQD
jgi:hypothetical protein